MLVIYMYMYKFVCIMYNVHFHNFSSFALSGIIIQKYRARKKNSFQRN